MAHFDPAHNKRAPADGARRIRPANPDERISLTLCVRRRHGAVLPDPMQLFTQPLRDRTYLSRKEFAAIYGAAPEDFARIVAFGESHGLVEKERSIARRLVVLSGTVEKVNAAFGVQLHEYERPAGGRYRGHEDPLRLPDDLTNIVEAVFGLDNRKMARAHAAPGSVPAPQTPPWAAQHYNFPAADGTGQTIGLIEFGNGYNPTDIRSFFAGLGIPAPALTAVTAGGAAPVSDPPDSEVTLDIAVAGSAAPGAKIAVYFAPWTEEGWVQAVGSAIHDAANAPSVLSISWGYPELQRSGDLAWSKAAIQKISELFQEAAHLGVTVFASTGDQGSSCAMADQKAHVAYPASDPWVTACGGTMIRTGTEFSEVVWSGPDAATGGGISQVFTVVPAWQQPANQQPSVNPGGHAGRGIPDVAGYAAGYNIVVGGAATPAPGTSGVAPLWAGLAARMNQLLGHNLGFLNPDLYGAINAAGALNAITEGNNNYDDTAPYYTAKPGWNACTGLGTPDGTKILAALTAAPPA
jgi:kumamolisin